MIKFDINSVDAPGLCLNVGFDDGGWERLDLWHPEDPTFVRFEITICLGMVGQVGTNYFSLEILTKRYLKEKGTDTKPQYVLVVDKFDWSKIRRLVKARIRACRREDWESSVEELRKHFLWEYEAGNPTTKEIELLPEGFFQPYPPAPTRH